MKCFVVLLLLASTHTAFATDALPLSQLYSQALSAYQDKKFQDSTELFSKALQLQPENPELLYNLGLSQYQLNKKGYAIALWRKALQLAPLNRKVQDAIEFARNNSGITSAFRRPPGTWEMIRSRLILPLPLNFWLGCMLIAFLLTAHKVIKFFGKRKVALQEGTSLPGIPYAALFLSLLLLLSLGASTLKGLDTLTAQGTIIAQRIDVRTGPSAEDNSIFELSEGVSVHLLATRQQWTLIRHFDGIQGWIPNSSLLQTQGPQL